MDHSHTDKPLGAWLWQIGRLIRLYHIRTFDDLGLCGMAHMVLFPLFHHDRLRQEEIAKILVADKSVIARDVKSLLKAGYVKRSRDPEDGRAYLVELTPKGRDLWDKIHAVHRLENNAMEKGFTSEERQQFTQFLERVLANLSAFVQEVLGEAPPPPPPPPSRMRLNE